MDVSASASYFRPEIQGLRGVAVLLVVVYHSGLGLSGGYIGVDIFFVISGYVITLLLLREYALDQTHVLRRFYKQRILRLLPAASVVIISVVLFSLLALSPTNEIPQVTDLARSTTKLAANFRLLDEPGYFLLQNPLQHMWSLAVEEQFYLIYPVALLLFLKCFRRNLNSRVLLLIAVTGISLLSLLGSISLTYGRGSQLIADIFQTTPQNFSFYMMPTRMWEFCVGVALALIPQATEFRFAKVHRVCALIGTVAVLYSATAFDSQTNFPGLAAILPVLGTALVIGSSRSPGLIFSFLTTRPMRFIGDVSYSWYLWHWPLIVFAMVLAPNNQFVVIVAAVISLLPATLSYRFIETQFRTRQSYTNLKFLAISSAFIIMPIVTASLVDAASTHLENRIPEMVAIKDNRFSVVNRCHNSSRPLSDRCLLHQTPSMAMAVLFGDSHAASASDGVVNAVSLSQISLGIATVDGCPPFILDPGGLGCQKPRQIYEQILQELQPEIVILINAFQHYVSLDTPLDRINRTFIVDSEIKYIQSLVDDGRHVVVVLEVPTMDLRGRVSLIQPELTTSITQLSTQLRRELLNNQLRSGLSNFANVSIVETDEIFCPSDECNPIKKGKLLYRDGSHLNREGSLKLVKPLEEAIQKQLDIIATNR
jgi:peptidoglycan/LPS O-acetylase OafA/YrhL